MATLPTAYASLRFGRKTIDFYAVSGEVVGSDPRARAEERRIQDLDGARHTLRLMEKGYRLEPGDSASVLRLQPGPERRSRPVAVASPSAQSWSRTHPGVPALLSRAGVSRSVNWWLTMALFALAALAIVWPYLHAFLVELVPGRIAALPVPDLFALAEARVPGLDTFRWSEAAGGLAPLLEAAGPGLAGQAGLIAFAAIAAGFAALVYAARSWRLVWAPVFVALAVVGAIGLDGPAGAEGPALAALGIAALLFVVGARSTACAMRRGWTSASRCSPIILCPRLRLSMCAPRAYRSLPAHPWVPALSRRLPCANRMGRTRPARPLSRPKPGLRPAPLGPGTRAVTTRSTWTPPRTQCPGQRRSPTMRCPRPQPPRLTRRAPPQLRPRLTSRLYRLSLTKRHRHRTTEQAMRHRTPSKWMDLLIRTSTRILRRPPRLAPMLRRRMPTALRKRVCAMIRAMPRAPLCCRRRRHAAAPGGCRAGLRHDCG